MSGYSPLLELGDAPMPETMKCPKCSYRSGDDWEQCNGACPMPGSPHYTAALASSGDHAELTDTLSSPFNACCYRDRCQALITEVAALRGAKSESEDDWAKNLAELRAESQRHLLRATEAERKLAEAVGLLGTLSLLFHPDSAHGRHVRSFLSKEAERG